MNEIVDRSIRFKQVCQLPREIGVVRVTGLTREKFTMGNIHGYVKKKNETAHDI